MSTKSREKKHARALQEEVPSLSYQAALNLIRSKTPEELDLWVAEAKRTAGAGRQAAAR